MATKAESIAIGVLKDQMKNVQEDVKEIKTDMKLGFSSLEGKIDALDAKYAAKWVQTAVAFVIALIVGAVLTALITLVIVPSARKTTLQPSDNTTTETINEPSGSGSAPSEKSAQQSVSGTPASAKATANSSASKPHDSETSPNGGVQVTLPKVGF
jgi:hypothetical protein